MERFEEACLVTDQDSLYDDLNEYWRSGRLRVKHRLADLVGEHDCRLYIVDTKVNDMHIWPAPLLADPDACSKLWLFLVSGVADTFRLQNLPANARFFHRKHSAVGDLVSFIRVHSDPELARKIAEVTYLDNVRSFFIRMKNGKMYHLRLSDLTEADSSPVSKWSISRQRDYIRVTQESGNRFEIPWDDVLYHCEPEYEYWKGRTSQGSDKNLEQIGERIRELRAARGLSISQLASKAGMKRPNLSRLEHGRHQPSLETLERIAEALESSLAELVAKRPARPARTKYRPLVRGQRKPKRLSK